MRFIFAVFCLLLTGCATEEVPQATYIDGGKNPVMDKGWFHFAGFDYLGRLAEGKPHGRGLCKDWNGPIVACEFNAGVRIDQNYVKKTLGEIGERDAQRREESRSIQQWNDERAARQREADRDNATNDSFNKMLQQNQNLSNNLNKMQNDTLANVNKTAQENRERSARNAERAEENRRIANENERIRQEQLRRQPTGGTVNQTTNPKTQEKTIKKPEQRQASADRQEQARQEEKARRQEKEKQLEQERQKETARKKAEDDAAKQAALAAENLAKAQYLKNVAAGSKLVAVKCLDGEGNYYATGKRAAIKPELVGCVDLSYRAYCPGGSYSSGVAHNFIGMSGCAFETFQITPKPNCKVEQVKIEITSASACK